MPYNTRRKSVSLAALGIQVPHGPRSSHRSPPAPSTSTPPPTAAADREQPPSKKVKRSHSTGSASPASPPRTVAVKLRDGRPKPVGRVAEQTPPPSPGREDGGFTIDTQGIDDDIVVGVIQQLEATGNRPHLLKELAAVLSAQLPVVAGSANPAAIISSRLAGYLKRHWTALSPCPVGKTLVGTHPKRIYYFLTNTPHLPVPDGVDIPPQAARIISPSISTDEEDADRRVRESLSPEIDLSTPELDDDLPPHTFPGRRDGSQPAANVNVSHNRRAASPPLERDEREFTQTASSLQQRNRARAAESAPALDVPSLHLHEIADVDASEEAGVLRSSEDAHALFGHDHLSIHHSFTMEFNSPLLKPQLELHISPTGKKMLAWAEDMEDVRVLGEEDKGLKEAWRWAELRSPETVELDELDDLFGGY